MSWLMRCQEASLHHCRLSRLTFQPRSEYGTRRRPALQNPERAEAACLARQEVRRAPAGKTGTLAAATRSDRCEDRTGKVVGQAHLSFRSQAAGVS